jgi:hypothetical protein
MGIERLRKNGWLDSKREEVDLPSLTDDQIEDIENGKQVVINNGNESILIYIPKNIPVDERKESDLTIRRFPIPTSTSGTT